MKLTHCTSVRFTVAVSCSDDLAAHSCPLRCLQSSDARLFSKTNQANLKSKPKIGNLTEKQAQNALAAKFNKTKN